MANPQQPELHRSGYGETTQDARKIRATTRDNASSDGDTGAQPRANQSEDTVRSGTKSTTRDALDR